MSASVRNRELTARQQRVIAALLASRSISEAASVVGINERTVRRWLEQSPFREALREAERAVLRNALGRIQSLTAKAADTLESLLCAQSEPVRPKAGNSRDIRRCHPLLPTAPPEEPDEQPSYQRAEPDWRAMPPEMQLDRCLVCGETNPMSTIYSLRRFLDSMGHNH